MKYHLILLSLTQLVSSQFDQHQDKMGSDAQIFVNTHCDLSQKFIWWKSYTSQEVVGRYRKEQCFYECESMVSMLLEREIIEPDVGPLCCNFAQWKDGSFTCDMMIGESIEFRT